MKDKLLRISGGLLVSGLLYGATTFLHAEESEVPTTPPITPPTVTVTLTPTPLPSATPTVSPTPTTSPTPSQSEGTATGGVQATLNGENIKLNFNAFGKSKVNGNNGKVMYSNSAGTNFKGDVDVCYYQSGTEAVFAGHVKSGSATEEYFLVKVQDNGEGKKAASDKFGVWLTDIEPPCTVGGYQVEVQKGNLQVH